MESPGVRILLTGARGFVGQAVLPLLLAQGHTVIATSRELVLSRQLGVEWRLSSLDEPMQIRSLLREVDAVIHLACARPATGQTDFSSVVHQAKTLRDAALECSLHRLIYVSTVGVYGNLQGPLSESSPTAPNSPYRLAKRQAEELFLQAPELPVSIVRLPFVWGLGEKRFLSMAESFSQAHFRSIGNGENRFHGVWVDDVAQGLLRCIEVEQEAAKIFILAGPKPMSLAELLSELGVGRSKTLPVLPFRILNSMADLLFRRFGLDWAWPRRYELFLKDIFFDFRETQKFLNYQPRVTATEAVRRMLS